MSKLDTYLNELAYSERQRVRDSVTHLLANIPSLSPSIGNLIFNDGTDYRLIVLSGTIPITYQRSSYNIPIEIYIPELFPTEAPITYVRPTSNMLIKSGHPNVNTNGFVEIPYVQQWNVNSTLVEAVTIMSSLFGSNPPLYSKPSNSPVVINPSSLSSPQSMFVQGYSPVPTSQNSGYSVMASPAGAGGGINPGGSYSAVSRPGQNPYTPPPNNMYNPSPSYTAGGFSTPSSSTSYTNPSNPYSPYPNTGTPYSPVPAPVSAVPAPSSNQPTATSIYANSYSNPQPNPYQPQSTTYQPQPYTSYGSQPYQPPPLSTFQTAGQSSLVSPSGSTSKPITTTPLNNTGVYSAVPSSYVYSAVPIPSNPNTPSSGLTSNPIAVSMSGNSTPYSLISPSMSAPSPVVMGTAFNSVSAVGSGAVNGVNMGGGVGVGVGVGMAVGSTMGYTPGGYTPPTTQLRSRKDQLIHEITAKLQGGLQNYFHQLREDLDREFAVQAELSYSAAMLDYKESQLKAQKEDLERVSQAVDEKKRELDAWVERNEEEKRQSSSSLDASSLEQRLTPHDPLSAQIVRLVSEIQALDDGLYLLSKAMKNCDQISTGGSSASTDLQLYLRETRKLAARQFLCKAHLAKIHANLLQQQQLQQRK